MNQMNNNMGMNQMGMNQMEMNQMGMNQMNNNMGMNPMTFNNPINMNNMSNMPQGNMFDDSFKIRNIVKPYEDKIKELEEKLRQKEFEIIYLKSKLNDNNIMISNQMNMNMMNPINPMNQMELMMNIPCMPQEEELITLLFEEKGKSSQGIKCSFDELNISVINKYCRKNFIEKDDYKFIFNGKKIVENLTVAENGLTNNSKINVIYISKNNSDGNNNNRKDDLDDKSPKINITFSTPLGRKINITCNINETVGDAIKKYLKRMNISEKKAKEFHFIYNAFQVCIEDNTKISVKFRLDRTPRIIVQDKHNLIGN